MIRAEPNIKNLQQNDIRREDMEYVGREEHNEFVKRIEEEEKRQNSRLQLLEEAVKQNTALTISVEKLANNMENMANEQIKQGKRLEALESHDGDMWRTAVKYVLTTVLGLAIGVVAMQIGLK